MNDEDDDGKIEKFSSIYLAHSKIQLNRNIILSLNFYRLAGRRP